MRCKRVLLCAFLACSATVFSQSGAAPDLREIVRRTTQRDNDTDRKARDYTYIQRLESRILDSSGQAKSTHSVTSQIMYLYGQRVEKIIEKDDKPLSGKDKQKEEDKLNKLIQERKNETPDQQQKRIAKEEKRRVEQRAYVDEIVEAYDFRFLPDESIQGRPVWVIVAEPRRSFQPKHKQSRLLQKFRFTAWVDKAEYAVVKLEGEATDTISIGWFLARLEKGMHFRLEQTRVNDELWLPQHMSLAAGARVALVKKVNLAMEIAYRDYQKFRVDSRIGEPTLVTPQ